MNWQAFYLGCFGVGLVLNLVSFLSGAVHLHLPVKWHIQFKGGHSGSLRSGTAARGEVHHAATHFPLFNSASLMVFLAWFGGVGFLLTTHARLWFLAVLALATVAGLSGAALVATFMVKVLDNPDATLEPMDFQMVGAVGKVNIAIRPGGTGEILYVQGGTRRSAGARSEDSKPLEKGAEVVITRFDRGIAYVRLWDEFTKEG
jgi:membrane protein implicated in regulation of membrane protease activity